MHKNIKTVAGCLSRVTCDITAPEGVDKTLTAFLLYEGESRPATLESADVIIFPAVPYGHYAYEVRCGGKPVAFGHLLVRPSAFPHTDGVVDYTLAADLSTTDAARVEINIAPGPRGPQGEKGEQGEPGTVDAAMLQEAVDAALYTTQEMTHTTRQGTTDINCRWCQIGQDHCPAEGELIAVSIPCRQSANAAMTAEPIYLAIFRETAGGSWEHLGTSLNALSQTPGTTSEWLFEPVTTAGANLILCPMLDRSATQIHTTLVLGARGTGNASAGTYVLNVQGSGESYLISATFRLQTQHPQFCPYDAGLSELLAHKDELLALLA